MNCLEVSDIVNRPLSLFGKKAKTPFSDYVEFRERLFCVKRKSVASMVVGCDQVIGRS
jgi:hypothetical protein